MQGQTMERRLALRLRDAEGAHHERAARDVHRRERMERERAELELAEPQRIGDRASRERDPEDPTVWSRSDGAGIGTAEGAAGRVAAGCLKPPLRAARSTANARTSMTRIVRRPGRSDDSCSTSVPPRSCWGCGRIVCRRHPFRRREDYGVGTPFRYLSSYMRSAAGCSMGKFSATQAATSARLPTPSLLRRLSTCPSAVRFEMNSRSAI